MRRQLPVYSPVTWRAVAAGVAAAVRGDRSGRLTRRLLDLLESRYGARDALLTDSGTTALRLAIAGGVGESTRPVALPGYGCYDLATAAEGAGAGVALYDLDPSTLGPNRESLEALESTRPAAVVVAHLFGYPVDVQAVRDVVRDAVIIEDAAQGGGGELHGRRLGSLGSVSVLSFGRGKGMTGGGGGALLAHDDRGAAILARVRDQAGTGGPRRGVAQLAALAAQLVLGRPTLYGIPSALPFLHLGETRYHPPSSPRCATTASRAVLERVIQPSDREVLARRKNAGRLLRSVAQSSCLGTIQPVPGGEPGYLRLPALVRGGGRRRLLSARVGRLGITHMYPTALATLPSLARHLVGPLSNLPGSELLAEALITLPTHSLLTEPDLRSIEGWLASE